MEQRLREVHRQLEKQYLKNAPPSAERSNLRREPESQTDDEVDTARKTRGYQIVPEPLLNSRDLQVSGIPKTNSEIRQIIKAIHGNEFLRRLDELQVSAMVECFRCVEYRPRETVISEGSAGTSVYIVAEGTLLVTQLRCHLRRLSAGDVFGELAILYDCKRTATVKAIGHVKLWEIHRQTFRTIMANNSRQKRQDTLRLLKGTQALKGMSDVQLSTIMDSMEECRFHPGDVIAQDDGMGTAFYIILSGEVQATQRANGKEELVGILRTADYFGELAPLRGIGGTVVYRAVGEVTCISMSQEDFVVMYPFDAVDSCDMDSLAVDALVVTEKRRHSSGSSPDCPSKPFRLKDLEPVLYQDGKHAGMAVTLGAGGYGRVELVTCGTWRPGAHLALKKISKEHVVRTRQQEHVRTERRVLQRSHSPFIVRLFQTFKDSRYVYMALEFCEGGDLWTKLREVKRFREDVAVFCCACVVEGLEYLHANGILYRDLKPENLMLDKHGYVKLVDFGFAKELRKGDRTYTFCGTPAYLAPEILRNMGHDFAVDFWMLGILAFEMLVGRPPFCSSDPRNIYGRILDGVITFPSSLSEASASIISKLCRPRPGQRLGNNRHGIRGLKKHRWFNKMSWKKLSSRQLEAPTVSLIKQGAPYINFKRYSMAEGTAEEEFSGWDEDF